MYDRTNCDGGRRGVNFDVHMSVADVTKSQVMRCDKDEAYKTIVAVGTEVSVVRLVVPAIFTRVAKVSGKRILDGYSALQRWVAKGVQPEGETSHSKSQPHFMHTFVS